MAEAPTAPTPQQLKMVDEKLGIIHILNGTTADGKDVFAYLSIRPSMYEEYCRKVKAHEPMNVAEYGDILHKGFGKEPSEEVKRHMEERFGIDPDFVEKWNSMLKEEIRRLKESRKE